MILFYSGFLLAEFNHWRRIAAQNATKDTGILGSLPSASLLRSKRLQNAFWLFIFLCGMFLGSQPSRGLKTGWFGWSTLGSAIPQWVGQKQRFWVGFGAILLVCATENAKFLQRIFDNGPVQYMGKISFALYLMHGPVTHTIGYGTIDILWRWIGRDTLFRKELAFGIMAVIDISCTVWAADIFWRLVDTPIVNFAKWFEDKWIVKLD